MKNIHVLPTDKPSRLGYLTKKGKEVFKDLRLFDKPMPNILDSENQHIYITSDEKPKKGDWCYDRSVEGRLVRYTELPKNWVDTQEKIIITTDPKLIDSGVQAIDDDFLQWFVKNPTCENVEVRKYHSGILSDISEITSSLKIIIPKEESETLEEAEKEFEKLLNGKALPTKQLTEVAEHYFIVGYEIGQEKRYSEEEVIKLLIDCKDRFGGSDLNDYTTDGEVKRWFEQFKKK